MTGIERRNYTELYGPTVGDRIRLADTDLLIQVERDLCGGPGRAGDEALLGPGGTLREPLGQARVTRAEGAPDTVITGVVVLDHWGVVKADVGIRNGRIAALAKAGNPDTMDRVHPGLVIGPETEVISGNGQILTAGAIDTGTHLVHPRVVGDALAAGVTTLVGGGTGPADGTVTTGVTPGPWHLAGMLQAMEAFPVNIALLGLGSTTSAQSLHTQVRSGAAGFRVHPVRGVTPAAVDACLTVCDATGVPLLLRPDPRNEAGSLRDTADAVAGRAVHATLAPGVGHPPFLDALVLAAEPWVLPGSTLAARPGSGRAAGAGPSPAPEGGPAAPAKEALLAAERVLHDLGALSILSSGGGVRGRIGELVPRAWRTAHLMRRRRGRLTGDVRADNHRARRYIAKYTINPAVAHGLDREIGSVRTGKVADLVLWDPAWFGVRPRLVIKGGQIVHGGRDAPGPGASTTPSVPFHPGFGAVGRAPADNALTFVAQPALDAGLSERLGLGRSCTVLCDTRRRGKENMAENAALPRIEVPADGGAVRVDGEDVEPEPPGELPMSRRYFLF
ncbi:urease subunit alpha [Wenjunlia vitaminophila]|uniref:Urease subunit alpha n=1 Tax=Wenjunlia vitaminophila TaxID=76728 RepID=A0A0T6LUQ6_WENVI|nr:amidohydrolase family protein [Wenjunlia vitaminophila]KRV49780.1 urease subunit alpha [Wenjunlia vitaminophila]